MKFTTVEKCELSWGLFCFYWYKLLEVLHPSENCWELPVPMELAFLLLDLYEYVDKVEWLFLALTMKNKFLLWKQRLNSLNRNCFVFIFSSFNDVLNFWCSQKGNIRSKNMLI